MARRQYIPNGPMSKTPISDSYSRGKYRGFDRGMRAHGDELGQHGPVKVIFTKNPHQVIDPPTLLGQRAGEMRQNAPKCEMLLRDALTTFEEHGIYFQHSVALHGFIADFYCPEQKIVIELDGPQHKDQPQYDRRRDWVFRKNGIMTLRYPSVWAHQCMDRILTDVAKKLTLL